MTHEARAGMARVLSLELALLSAEVNLLEELKRAGILPEGTSRTPTAPELRAGVRFAELDRIVTEAAALLARKADRVRDAVLDGLAEQLADAFTEPDPYVVLAQLDALTDPTSGAVLPGLRDVVDEVAVELAGDLERTAAAGAAEALDEGRRQGLGQLVPDEVDLDDEVRAAATAHGQRVAKAPAERLLTVAAEAGQRAATATGATGATVLEAALDAAEQASRAGTEDLARQAANVTHGLGRQRAQAAMPAPREVYASELLDRNTCGPCATVDGRTYATLEDALVDYPGAGGFIGCDGGSRCRGTLVLVHSTEAAPTLDNPGQGPGSPGGPADRTPRGPASPAPAPATGPLLPDPGTAASSATTYAALDDTGATVMPVEDLEPPVDPVAPADVDRDPELATYSDEELDRLLVDDTAPMDRRMAAADELDQRAAGTRERVWVEDDYTPEQLAEFEAQREAWEAAGGNYDALASAVTGAKPAGRLIDRVKSEWTAQLELNYIAAEDATNGYLIRRDRYAEFLAKYGGADQSVLFEGPARVAYYYASRELRDHWDTLPNGRESFAEYALARGIADAKTKARAQAARNAREDARLRADESAAGQEKRARQRAEKARRRGPLTAGERLAREQRRRDRIRARERKLAAEAQRGQDPTPTLEDPDE